MIKHILIIGLILLGAYLTDGFTNDIGGLVLLGAGLWGGYLDGKKAGRREILGGDHKNPIK